MKHYLPEISWHSREGILTVDIQPIVLGNEGEIVSSTSTAGDGEAIPQYRVATGSLERNIRVGKICCI